VAEGRDLDPQRPGPRITAPGASLGQSAHRSRDVQRDVRSRVRQTPALHDKRETDAESS